MGVVRLGGRTPAALTAARQRTAGPDVSGTRSVDSPATPSTPPVQARRHPLGPDGRSLAPVRAGRPRPARTTEPLRRSSCPRDPLAAQVVEPHRRDSIRLGSPHEVAIITASALGLSPTSRVVPTEMVPRRDQPLFPQSHEKNLYSAAIGAPRLCRTAKTGGPNSSATAHGLALREAPPAAPRARRYARPGRAGGATTPRRAAQRRRSLHGVSFREDAALRANQQQLCSYWNPIRTH